MRVEAAALPVEALREELIVASFEVQVADRPAVIPSPARVRRANLSPPVWKEHSPPLVPLTNVLALLSCVETAGPCCSGSSVSRRPCGMGWAPKEGGVAFQCYRGKVGRATPAGKTATSRKTTTAVCKARGRLSGERGHQSLLETSTVLDTYLLRDDNEINPACTHFPCR